MGGKRIPFRLNSRPALRATPQPRKGAPVFVYPLKLWSSVRQLSRRFGYFLLRIVHDFSSTRPRIFLLSDFFVPFEVPLKEEDRDRNTKVSLIQNSLWGLRLCSFHRINLLAVSTLCGTCEALVLFSTRRCSHSLFLLVLIFCFFSFRCLQGIRGSHH